MGLINTIIVVIIISLFVSCKKSPGKISYSPPYGANYQYEDIQLILKCRDILAGSLTYQTNKDRRVPAVILITGSSPHDRDNSKPERSISSYRPFRQIADKLSSSGIAVLRMDDRGVGESIGGDIKNMTTKERALDIMECLRYLRSRSEIDSSRIGLLGLSEGASIAHMIASFDKSIKVIVLLSGIGSSGKEIISYQVKNGVIDEKMMPKLLKKDKNLKYLYEFDPLQTVRMIKQPVLIIHGKKDRRVPFTDAFKLENELKLNGNNNVTVKILEEHNHALLEEDSTGVETSYGTLSSNQISDEVLTIITNWINIEI